MAEVYLLVLLALAGTAVWRGLLQPGRLYEYPYFMAAVFAIFIAPQAISLLRFSGRAPADAVEAVLLMSCLCLSACFIGYCAKANRWVVLRTSVPIDPKRLFLGGIVFVACGYIFSYLISQLPSEETSRTMWTGRVTIYGFFATLIYPGFSICLTAALRTGKFHAWFMSFVAAFPPLFRVVFAGRREAAVLFLISLGLTFYYQKRVIPSRIALGCVIVGAMLVIPATERYRSAIVTGGFRQVNEIDFVENFNRYLNRASTLELRNAAMIIDVTSDTGRYEYGRSYWDQLVFRFVPAQILGRDFKESLMFRTAEDHLNYGLHRRGYKVPVGSTITGMGDSFRQFGYFGALFFVVLGVIFRSVWEASQQSNAIFAQLLYIQTATSAMRAVTHQTVDYLPGLLYNLIFLGLLTFLARLSRGHQPRRIL